MFRVVIALIFMQLMGCSAFPSSSSNSTSKPISLEFAEPNRIQFRGKGAGAGIALMSTMGPVGIALGVAIDEGIAKDIRKAISQNIDKDQADIQSQIKKQLSKQLEKHDYSVMDSNKETYPKLIIKRFGFKIINGSTDATAAEWAVELHLGPDEKSTVNYPKDFDKSSVKTYALSDLKTNGKLGLELFTNSFKQVIESLLN